MPITTLGIGAAVTPTVVKTTFSHYTNRKPRAKKPTAHISYDQGLHLIRSFLLYASHHTVEEVQSFTGQWVPHPTWIRTENVPIPAESISAAADLLIAELGGDGIEAIGGSKWWQWRRKHADLKAEWIEMRSDFNARQREKAKCRRVMLYVHGGGYFFGSVDEHRYQLQRHARKLQARVFAPRYRLAPQFPFPCGLLDCLAAYQYLLTIHQPNEIIFAGDSAGGGMILSMLCILRDQNAPLPAGGILISPWVDLTHSFPSLTREDELDYIPAHGFIQKPSRSWPPPNEDQLQELEKAAAGRSQGRQNADTSSPSGITSADAADAAPSRSQQQSPLSLQLDGKDVFVKDQIQLYTTNQLITHPLVSPVLQPSLGGLPPLLVMVGGGERLRDEQIYLAHKAANPPHYKLSERWRKLYDPDDSTVNKYKPTPVQLQVWEDLCHVVPTLSFTRPAKFMYRSIAQFGAWALSRAQQRAIEIVDDDQSSIASESSDEDSAERQKTNQKLANGQGVANGTPAHVGKAGDPLPPFRNSMIREQVDRHGNIFPLPRAEELAAIQMGADGVGVVKEGPIRRWLAAQAEWDHKYASLRRKIHRQRLETVQARKPHSFGDLEYPPPSALAGRQYDEDYYSRTQRLKKSWGLGMWSSWSWKHDERILQKETEVDDEEKPDQQAEPPLPSDGLLNVHQPAQGNRPRSTSRASRTSRASGRRKTISVRNEGQIEGEEAVPPIPHAAIQDGQPDMPDIANAQLPVGAPEYPTITEPPDAAQSTPPMFIPKWKTAAHLRDSLKDVSDAGSTYSKVMPDNASTTAVFSAPGVQRVDSQRAETSDTRSVDTQPPTPGFTDNLCGYDTPVSRRSVERLQRHQTEFDGQSIHSSMLAYSLNEITSSRIQPLRSPSAVAMVQAEGVISPVDASAPTANVAASSAANMDPALEGMQREVLHAQSHTTDGKTPLDGEKLIDQNTSATENEKRPGLYDRQDSTFVTAQEDL